MSKWISVKDSLPLDADPVISLDAEGDTCIGCCFFNPGTGTRYWESGMVNILDELDEYHISFQIHDEGTGITHWMYLPEADEEEK